MNTKYLILATIFVFTAALGGFFWMQQTGPFSQSLRLHGPVSEEEHTVYAADGTGIYFTLSYPAAKKDIKNNYIIIMADRNLDRDWNTTAVRFFTGRDLARYLSSAGYYVVRADQRGTGKTRPSGLNFADPENAASDASRIIQWLKQEKKASSFLIIAHGESCSSALHIPEKAAGYILLSCASKGTLLDAWGDRLLNNMKKAGVPHDILSQSEKDLAYWIQSKKDGRSVSERIRSEKQSTRKEERPLTSDQIAFYKALEFMDTSEKMKRWPEIAARLNLSEDIKKTLRNGIPVLHLNGETNAEISEELSAYWKNEAAPELSRTGRDLYSFREISHADHFFKERGIREASALDMFLVKMDPFKKTSADLLLLTEAWLNERSL